MGFKIFGVQFGVNTSSNSYIQPQTTTTQKGRSAQQFATTLGPVLKGDITKPYIDSTYVSEDMYVPFSISEHYYDNAYPQLIDRMYYQSPLHSSIVKLKVNASVGGGFEIVNGATDGPDRVKLEMFSKKARKAIKAICMDIVMHGRVHIKITKDAMGKPIKFERVMPSNIRLNKCGNLHYLSQDWIRTTMYTIYNKFRMEDKTEGDTFLTFQQMEFSPGQEVYALPKEISAYNFISMDGQTGALYKKALEKTIFGNLVIRRPKAFEDNEEFEEFKKTIQNKEGEIVPALVLAGDSFDNVPEVEAFPATMNDKLFENADERIDVKICQAHEINPVIIGVSTKANSLGNGSDINAAYPQFEKNVVKPLREQIEEIFDDLMMIFGIEGNFVINNFQIVDEEIVDKTKVEQNKNTKK